MRKALAGLLAGLLLAPLALPALGAAAAVRLDRSPHDPNDLPSLQTGVKIFVNYCLGCHGAQYMRYNRLTDLGLTEMQIRDNLLFTGERVGDTMAIPLDARDARTWFGVAPPDLSVIARSRGADWLYTYLRGFYRDPATPIGWNNVVFPNVAMPHALWTLQGERAYDAQKGTWTTLSEGTQGGVEYDTTVRDLVNFLVYMGEPAAQKRKRIGIVVLFALAVLFAFSYLLKREYWKDVH
jgi:ubiquinol-cytochrome c reductase cytochrome c1 subunit